MSSLDLETAENAGYFILALAMVPRAWYAAQPAPVIVEQSDHYYPPATWWLGQRPTISIREYCDRNLDETGPSCSHMEEGFVESGWSDDHGHQIDLVENLSGDVLDCWAEINIRKPYSEFLDCLIFLAAKADCMFYEYGAEGFHEPSRKPIIEAISTHEMAHAHIDSSGNLAPN